jgi:hypothetical protein
MQKSKPGHMVKPSFGKPYALGMPHYCATYHTISPLAIYFEGFRQFGRNVVWTSQSHPASSV